MYSVARKPRRTGVEEDEKGDMLPPVQPARPVMTDRTVVKTKKQKKKKHRTKQERGLDLPLENTNDDYYDVEAPSKLQQQKKKKKKKEEGVDHALIPGAVHVSNDEETLWNEKRRQKILILESNMSSRHFPQTQKLMTERTKDADTAIHGGDAFQSEHNNNLFSREPGAYAVEGLNFTANEYSTYSAGSRVRSTTTSFGITSQDSDLLTAQVEDITTFEDHVENLVSKRVKESFPQYARARPPSPTPHQQQREQQQSFLQEKGYEIKWMMTMCCCLLLVAAAVAGVVVGIQRRDDMMMMTTPNTRDPISTTVPSMSPTTTTMVRVMNVIEPVSNLGALSDPTTPQYAAVQWLLEEEEELMFLGTLTDEQLLERYIWTTLYFATDGPQWEHQRLFLIRGESVCAWGKFINIIHLGLSCVGGDHVKEVNLESTGLSGTLPDEFGYLKNLENANLGGNQLQGTIPATVGNMTSMQVMRLFSSSLEGKLPSSIGELRQLTYLDLSENRIDRPLPTEIGHLSQLRQFFFKNNQCTGTIPSEIGSMISLQLLDFSSNKFDGTIPSELQNCQDLASLGLNSNLITGDLSDTLERMPTSLQVLQVAHNNLNGTIPSSGRMLQLKLTEMDLESNDLDGTLPTEIGILTSMVMLNLFNNNKLSGTLPTELGQLSPLRLLNVGVNRFSGTLPTQFRSLANLRILGLADNMFSGDVTVLRRNLPIVNLQLQNNNWTSIASICEEFQSPGVQLNGNSCEKPAQFSCECCTHCCPTPPFEEQSCRRI